MKYVTVTLTEREAQAVVWACWNLTMDIGDTPGDQGMKAACRAQLKIRRARGEDVSGMAAHWPYSGRHGDYLDQSLGA